MQEFIKADIFFFITAIAVLLVAVGFLVLIFYLIRIVNDFRRVSKSIRDMSEVISGDIHEVREKIKSGNWLKNIFDLFSKMNAGKVAKSKKRKTAK